MKLQTIIGAGKGLCFDEKAEKLNEDYAQTRAKLKHKPLSEQAIAL